MDFFAIKDKELVLNSDGFALREIDFQFLCGHCDVIDRFSEVSTGINALGISASSEIPQGFRTMAIREKFALDGIDGSFSLARAKALLGWRANTRFCGRCGSFLKDDENQTARVCPDCGNVIFPRIEPCIIVLVTREDGRILLARHVQRNQDIYACIAGFMEAGESAEHAVAREIMEETGLKVKNIKYFGSQSWPFPSQLMLGYTAEYDGGELILQEDEIADAGWFDREDCPASPRPGSIAYRLIHDIR